MQDDGPSSLPVSVRKKRLYEKLLASMDEQGRRGQVAVLNVAWEVRTVRGREKKCDPSRGDFTYREFGAHITVMGGSFQNRTRPSPVHDGRHYDAAHAYLTKDLDFWLRQVQRCGSPVLELACGTGRVAIPLAQAGHRVTGLDNQSSMLKQAESKARAARVDVEWVRGDMRRFHLAKRFATVILPFNGLCLLHALADAERLLDCVRNHLAPGGHFVLDVNNPRLEQFAGCTPTEGPFARYEFEDPDGTGSVVAAHRRRYDRAAQILEVSIRYNFPDGTVATDQLRMRMYFPQELRALLHYNGFRVVEAHGDYDERPLEPRSDRQLLVCQRR